MKSARKQYIREQKTICGDSYAEVDFCWITEREHREKSNLPAALPSKSATGNDRRGCWYSC